MATRPQPGEDQPVGPGTDLTVLRAIREAKSEAEQAKRDRLIKNRINSDAFLGRQDWSHKQAGQSQEFLPKTSISLEQFSQFFKRATSQFGVFFSVDVPAEYPLPAEKVVDLMMCYLENLREGEHGTTTFPLVLADAIKSGALESLVTLKIHGRRTEKRRFYAERAIHYKEETLNGQKRKYPTVQSTLATRTESPWNLIIDVVPAEYYFPDPTGRNLYKIHSVERDLHDVIALADEGIYDKAAVEKIQGDFADQQEIFRQALRRNQRVAQPPPWRKRVKIDEYWGDLLDSDGHIIASNIVCTMADKKYLIRPPEDNPFWHGDDPFVSAPLIRVPLSVWHKALYDDASPLNVAINELFNLMLDGALASVWGVRQLRMGWLEDARDVAGGIPQGKTLAIKDEVPIGAQVLENVTQANVPSDALAMYNLLDREYQASTLTNDLKMGLLPPKQVKATEVVEATQSSAVTLDGIVADVERQLISPALKKVWMTILQNADFLDTKEVRSAIGAEATLRLSQMSRAERFASMATPCSFKVQGLSGTLARARDFQKTMALLQAVTQNPLLLQAFTQRYSADATLQTIMKQLNINPETLEQTPEEKAALPQRLQQLPMFQQLTGQTGASAQMTGEPQLPAEINQLHNPLTGLTGAK